jgi:hypothetical protein
MVAGRMLIGGVDAFHAECSSCGGSWGLGGERGHGRMTASATPTAQPAATSFARGQDRLPSAYGQCESAGTCGGGVRLQLPHRVRCRVAAVLPGLAPMARVANWSETDRRTPCTSVRATQPCPVAQEIWCQNLQATDCVGASPVKGVG